MRATDRREARGRSAVAATRRRLLWTSSNSLAALPVWSLVAAGHVKRSHVLPYVLGFALSAIALGLAGGFVAWARSRDGDRRVAPGHPEDGDEAGA